MWWITGTFALDDLDPLLYFVSVLNIFRTILWSDPEYWYCGWYWSNMLGLLVHFLGWMLVPERSTSFWLIAMLILETLENYKIREKIHLAEKPIHWRGKDAGNEKLLFVSDRDYFHRSQTLLSRYNITHEFMNPGHEGGKALLFLYWFKCLGANLKNKPIYHLVHWLEARDLSFFLSAC